jgi:hypothetical protein
MKNFFLLGFLAITLSFAACGSDDDGNIGPAFCNDQAFGEAVANATSSLSDAATLFANDPTTANCEAYRTAAQNYLDEIRRFEGCSIISARDDFRESLREAQASVDMIMC